MKRKPMQLLLILGCVFEFAMVLLGTQQNKVTPLQVNSIALFPDLIVTAIRFTPERPTTADPIMILVDMKNQGKGPAVIPAGAMEWKALLPSGRGSGGLSDGETIPPGGTFTRGVNNFLNSGELAAGSYTIKAVVDPDGRCAESNEGNNEKTAVLTITEGGKPDLLITDMHLDPAQITLKTDFRIVVTIRNQGNAPAVFPDGTRILAGDMDYEYAPSGGTSIKPGETRTYRKVNSHVQVGTFTWKATVDPENIVRESDETNNTRSLQVRIK
jgi:hypothetical protein